MKDLFPITSISEQRAKKEQLLHQKSIAIWMTGLSGSGKSTIALGLERKLEKSGFLTQILDGDNIRNGLNKNLQFSIEDRNENLRRIAEVNVLFLNCGIITINSFISPTEDSRNTAREIIGDKDFIEVFIAAPLDVCEKRDVKGIYKKARAGIIKNFTGIDSTFEIPKNADLIIESHKETVEESVLKLFNYVQKFIKD